MSIAERLKNSVMLKLAIAGFLMLVLLLPAGIIQSLVNERSNRRNEAVGEVSEKWGRSQEVAGPILVVPYREIYKDDKGIVRRRLHHAYFLPERLSIQSEVQAQTRRRGIYEVTLYTTQLKLTGEFRRPDFGELQANAHEILWREASLSVGIPDTRGIRDSRIAARLGTRSLEFQPGAEPTLFASGIQARVGELGGARMPFEIAFDLQGSSALSFAPLGKQTTVEMRSDWKDPSFFGAFLPAKREIGPTGFNALWKVSFFGRNIPQSWSSESIPRQQVQSALRASDLGVRLIVPVDFYQKVERAVKYALLFIGLTFLAFLLFEIFNRLHIHPMQYTLVGAALCVFYLLFLSLSEHIGFTLAYLSAAVTIIALIAGYCRRVLGDGRGAVVMVVLLTALYGYLYFVLQSEDYALLLGSVLVLAVLAAVMYLTRNIDWYSVSLGKNGASATGRNLAADAG